MLYSLKRIFHNIKKNFGVYLILVLEFALGMGIFLGCQNIISSAEKELEKAKAKTKNTEVYINYWVIPALSDYSNDPYKFPITYERYLELNKKFCDEFEIRYAPYDMEWLSAGNIDNPETISFFVFFANDVFFENIFNTKMNHQTAYFGAEVMKSMQNLMGKYDESIVKAKLNPNETILDLLSFKDNNLKLFSREILNIATVPSTNCTYIEHPNGSDVPHFELSECIFISLDYYPEYERMYRENIDKYDKLSKEERLRDRPLSMFSSISVIPKENFNVDSLAMLLSELNSVDSVYDFFVNQPSLEIQKTIQYLNGSLSTYQKTATGLLLIVILGNIGIILIQIHRRQKAIAISCAYGATMGRIAFEIFVELLIITLAGVILSFIGLHFAMPLMHDIYSNTIFNLLDIFVAIPIALVTILVPTIVTVWKLKKINISYIFKSI